MRRRRVVLDTNVVFSALNSRAGAGFKLLSLLDEDRFEIALSVPLVFEYEDVLSRHLESGLFHAQEINSFLDYLCTVAHRQDIFFLWRPCLPDPQDDQVLELAIAASCEGIVTYNQRDFVEARRFGIHVYSPKEFLQLLEEVP
jgi:putative PIN family toxin of toxin-antitoxin system